MSARVRLALMCLSIGGVLALPAAAEPRAYALDLTGSSVGFETDFGTSKIAGSMPVRRADLTIDFDRLRNCTVDVLLDTKGAEANFPFAAEAMRGPGVLDAGRFPTIRFVSTSVRGTGETAEVTGALTLRGITRPATLRATIYRQAGRAAADRSHLTVLLTGAVRRSDYGATGFADMVGDTVRLRILARIAAVD